MKRYNLVISCFVCCILLFICSFCVAASSYTVERNDVVYIINPEEHTISDGTNLYTYDFSGNSETYEVEITYPDGSSYWWEMNGASGFGGWSDDYDPKRYVDGDVLCEVLREKAPSARHLTGHGVAAFLLFVIGLFHLIAPETAWYLQHGWIYKNAEPSDAILLCNRIGGVAAILFGVVVFFL